MVRCHKFIPAFLVLAIGLVLTSGCAFRGAGKLLNDIPLSPAAAYVPRSPLPEAMSIPNEQDDSLDGKVLTLARCIEIALERNPETRASWQRVRVAAAGVGQARSTYLPSADFTAGINRSNQVSLDGRQETGPDSTFDGGFGVRYLLFDGGARAAGLKGAEAELLGADFQHNTTLQDVALNVEEGYYQLLAARELRWVAEQTVRQTQYHVDVARARYENGIVARSDVLKADTEKANADLQLVRARSEVRIARGGLANAMGMKPSEPLDIAELPRNLHRREVADAKRLMADGAANRPELRTALARVESARANVKTGQARYWPEVTFNSDYGWRDRTFVPDRDEWSLGLGITWPLFEGFNRKYSVQRAKADLAKSAAEYEKILRGVELDVWTAYSQLIEADQAVEAAHALVASAEESARVTEGEYKNGTTSIIEVTDAQTARTTANVRLVQARLDWHTALARLERAIGRTLARKEDGLINGDDKH
jgi:TolC family type I secretion outer membrane protein